MKNLQREHAVWVAEKYPDQPAEVPALGCLEEAGELVHAVLKAEQVRIWGEDGRYNVASLRAKLVDAIGDCGIYACSLCNANGWNFVRVYSSTECYDEETSIRELVIDLVVASTDVASDPHYEDALVTYVYKLKEIAHRSGLDATAAILATWNEVKQR